jgi:hypothetical protein
VVHGVQESHFLQRLTTTLGTELGKIHLLHDTHAQEANKGETHRQTSAETPQASSHPLPL